MGESGFFYLLKIELREMIKWKRVNSDWEI